MQKIGATYWVTRFEERDRQPNSERTTLLPPFAVQRLSSGAEGDETAYFSAADSNVTLGGAAVPMRVLEIAQVLEEGEGRYVDDEGLPAEAF